MRRDDIVIKDKYIYGRSQSEDSDLSIDHERIPNSSGLCSCLLAMFNPQLAQEKAIVDSKEALKTIIGELANQATDLRRDVAIYTYDCKEAKKRGDKRTVKTKLAQRKSVQHDLDVVEKNIMYRKRQLNFFNNFKNASVTTKAMKVLSKNSKKLQMSKVLDGVDEHMADMELLNRDVEQLNSMLAQPTSMAIEEDEEELEQMYREFCKEVDLVDDIPTVPVPQKNLTNQTPMIPEVTNEQFSRERIPLPH